MLKICVIVLLIHPTIMLNSVSCLGCNFSSDFSDVGWFVNDIPVVNEYLYFAYGSQIKYGFDSIVAAFTCYDLLAYGDVSFYYYNFGVQKHCEKSVLTSDKGALLVSTVRNDNITSASDCQSMFTDSCYNTSACTASWRPKVLPPYTNATFASSGVQCPFSPGVYSASTPMCTATLTISATEMSFSSCSPIPTNSSTSPLTVKGLHFYTGLKLKCLGLLSGQLLNPSETANILLLATDPVNDSYCAQFVTGTNGTVFMTLDVTDKVGIIACGTRGVGDNVFVSMNIVPPSSTTNVTSTYVSYQSTSPGTTTQLVSGLVSTSPVTTTQLVSGLVDATQSTAGFPSQLASLASTESPVIITTAVSSQTTEPTATQPSVTELSNHDNSVVKGVLIGVLVGFVVLAVIAGLVWYCAKTPRYVSNIKIGADKTDLLHAANRRPWPGHRATFNYPSYINSNFVTGRH